MRWATGVTTCPARRDTTLPRTLASLAAAGFDRPRLFADGIDDPADWECRFGLPVTARHPAIKIVGNLVLGLWELLVREPAAERYAMFQDDVIASRNLRGYLEAAPYPVNGYLNLYEVTANRASPPRGIGFEPSAQLGQGALALVFDRLSLMTLLTHANTVVKPTAETKPDRSVDGMVVTSMGMAGIREYVHHPSLVQHIGIESTMQNALRPIAETFRGEDFDAMTLLRKS